jgi:hypothetical protein
MFCTVLFLRGLKEINPRPLQALPSAKHSSSAYQKKVYEDNQATFELTKIEL